MDDVGSSGGAITDGELLKRTRCGDREAFGVLYERRHELVPAFCSSALAIRRSRWI
jgi:hypothetical protein